MSFLGEKLLLTLSCSRPYYKGCSPTYAQLLPSLRHVLGQTASAATVHPFPQPASPPPSGTPTLDVPLCGSFRHVGVLSRGSFVELQLFV